MNFNITVLFSLSILFFRCANAFNITNLLDKYSDFSSFNNYLTRTGLAGEINSRRTITVLAVDNSALSSVEGKSSDMLKNVLSVHIVLDYYDVSKLQHLPNKSMILTTLFQTSGHASGEQGFLNVTNVKTGSVVFGSAAKGSTLGADLVKSVASQPYNLSVLQVSNVIVPMGIENSTTSPAPAPAPGKAKSPSKSLSPDEAPAPSNATASPKGSAPSAEDVPPKGDGPTADAPAADSAKSRAATTLVLSLGLVMLILSSTLSTMWMIW
ncbi:fasciclin-like arabinogalactan protein 14 [Cornus florida]|uniref:fasciclin-like arabinogalactan protein 14 n=1 Tax=Cornus florida TaxID=4283 RepID=UPI002898816D|nr:fasciclin-like arabinogalactan protein 14 [Cornus florida]